MIVRSAMTDAAAATAHRWFNGWRIAGWGSLLALFVLPALAMQFTDEVHWTGMDFVFAAVLLCALGLGIELALRIACNGAQRLGMAIAVAGGFLTVWVNGAVGMIGSENEPINLAFVLLVGAAMLAGAVVRFRPRAMQMIMGVLAVGQFALGAIATQLMPGHAIEWGVLVFFAMIWATAALCFHRAVWRAE